MTDLINRDHAAQAIEAYICSQCDHDTDRDPACIACPHLDGNEILESVPSVSRWISVEDALPEKDKSYITYAERNRNEMSTVRQNKKIACKGIVRDLLSLCFYAR